MSTAKTTTNHDEIKRWVEARDGHPACIRTGAEGGLLRIDFGEKEEDLEPISWDEFFKIFDENHLNFLYQEEAKSGRKSRFNKFVDSER